MERGDLIALFLLAAALFWIFRPGSRSTGKEAVPAPSTAPHHHPLSDGTLCEQYSFSLRSAR